MSVADESAVLIDTSTLLSLDLDRFSGLPRLGGAGYAAIEALVLFDRVYLDGASVQGYDMHWLVENVDGVELLNDSAAEVERTYRRGAQLAGALTGSEAAQDVLSGFDAEGETFAELGLEDQLAELLTGPTWNAELKHYVAHAASAEMVRVFDEVFDGRPMRADGPIILMRLFYYLALQERIGSLLLLHPSKSYGSEVPGYGYARRFFDAFDERVREAYLERRRRWLGDQTPVLSLPLLSRYVRSESDNRGWSLGRTVAWMRTQPEVFAFRAGMKALLDGVDSGDAVAVDAILSELDAACAVWSKKLGAPLPKRTVSLQVALPFLAPAVDVPVPGPRSAGRKMLVLIDRMLQNA